VTVEGSGSHCRQADNSLRWRIVEGVGGCCSHCQPADKPMMAGSLRSAPNPPLPVSATRHLIAAGSDGDGDGDTDSDGCWAVYNVYDLEDAAKSFRDVCIISSHVEVPATIGGWLGSILLRHCGPLTTSSLS
jgi:hypothetical protein